MGKTGWARDRSRTVYRTMMKIFSRIILIAVLLGFAPSAWALGWGLPTAGTDSGGGIPWSSLNLAYNAGNSPPIGDYSIDYASNGGSAANQFGNWAEFTFPAAYCDAIGVYADSGAPAVDYVQIEVWDTAGAGSWVTICGSTPLSGSFPANGVLVNDTWTVISFTSITISKIRFRYHYTIGGWTYWLWNIAYHSIPLVINLPTVATLTPYIDLNSAVLQGQITDDGGAICTAQFEYGTTTSYELGTVSVVPSGTTYSIGMICGAFLGGLTTGQTYHYRMNVTNSAGTTQGNDITFTPAATQVGWWVDPTGDIADPSPPAGAQQWQNRAAAYDDDDQTFATLSFYTTDTSPTTYLYLTHSVALTCDKIRLKASTSANITAMEVWINTGTVAIPSWTSVFNSGTYPDQQWLEVPFAATAITGARIRFSVAGSVGFVINVTDVDFHVVGVEHCYGFVDGAFSWANQ